MKKPFHSNLIIQFIGSLATSIALWGCSGSKLDTSSSSVNIQAEVLRAIPLTEADDPSRIPQFRLDQVKFSTLRNVSELSGDFFQVRRGARIIQNSIEFDESPPPFRYHLKKDVIVPSDFESLTMLSSYYQFERVVETLQPATDLGWKELKRQFGKMDILYHPSQHNEERSACELLKQNAAYASYPLFLVTPSSPGEEIPLGSNLQVIAHEMGHLVFHLNFHSEGKGLDLFSSQVENIRGINEGFADLVSYTVSGSTNILGGSFSKRNPDRDFSQVNFNAESLLVEYQTACSGGFYCVGTLFANALYKAKQQSPYFSNSLEHRLAFLKQVIPAIQGARDQLSVNRDVTYPSAFSNANYLGLFLSAFVSSFTDMDLKSTVKNSLEKNFKSIDNPPQPKFNPALI